jgi:hypothetical protein
MALPWHLLGVKLAQAQYDTDSRYHNEKGTDISYQNEYIDTNNNKEQDTDKSYHD